MSKERTITTIHNFRIPPRAYTRVAIYCRVSTSHTAQEESLEAQIDKYKKMVASRNNWQLVDVYSDMASGKSTSGRTEFIRLMNDCEEGKIDLILCKSISRFGRNTVEILTNIYKLREHNVDAIFEVEDMRISETGKDFLLAVLSGLAQEDSTSRSQNIKMGIDYKLKNGTSHLYTRPCYGYIKNGEGELIIDNENAENVRAIFNLYLQGHSVLSIIKELEKQKIKSPTGKEIWSKRSIETLLSNEKYIGNVLAGKTYSDRFPSNKRRINKGEQQRFLVEKSHEPIIQREIFEDVQQERVKRSNIDTTDGKTTRKDTHYSKKASLKNNED